MLPVSTIFIQVYEKTTCQFQLEFTTKDYLQMDKTLQLFTNIFTFNKNKFISIKVIKLRMYRHKVIKNAKLIKVWIKLKLIIVPGLMK